jgi:NTP pyrophosphatase (non-canonical NTP hydrolase)
MERPQISDAVLLQTIEALTVNMGRRIEEKGRGAFASPHEMLGVIAEEYHELIEAVRLNSAVDIGGELADIAVACLFSIATMIEADIQIKAAQEALEAEIDTIQSSER